jgi:uncharacterized protein (TIGR02118 family)
MIVFSVLYPSSDGAHFDHDYYIGTHMPLARKNFGPGVRDVKILKGVSDAAGGAPAYVVMAHLIFESEHDMTTAMSGPRAAEVFADLPNFTNIQPITQVSTLD